MDFYKYLVQFNENNVWAKLTFPSIKSGSLNFTQNEVPTKTTAKELWVEYLTNATNYFKENDTKGSISYTLFLSTSRTDMEEYSLGQLLLSGTSKIKLKQTVYGMFNLPQGLFTNCIYPYSSNNAVSTSTSTELQLEAFDTVKINGLTALGSATITGEITSDTYCQAPYFNATSDRRAKTNIQPYKGDALSLIDKLTIYTFNYLKDDSASIGMIAQEAQIFDNVIPNFSLVNNEEATGENDDYMTIKESKLVYILWKAVQDLNAKSKELQKRITDLEDLLGKNTNDTSITNRNIKVETCLF